MGTVKTVGREIISLQLKSLIIFEFLNLFNEFEQLVRNVFERNIPTLPPPKKQQLYFFYGGKLGTYIEYEESTVKLSSIKYKEEEYFKELTINQILRIFKTDPCIGDFNFDVESLQRSTTVFPFIDCAIKLIKMRNKLAHDLVNLKFRNDELIELLTLDKIKNESFSILQNFDIDNIDNITQHIASNIIYMRKMIAQLKGE